MPEARAPLPHTQGLGESPLAPAAGSRTLTVPACRQAAQKRGKNWGAGDRLVPQEARPSPLGVGAGGLRTPKAHASCPRGQDAARALGSWRPRLRSTAPTHATCRLSGGHAAPASLQARSSHRESVWGKGVTVTWGRAAWVPGRGVPVAMSEDPRTLPCPTRHAQRVKTRAGLLFLDREAVRLCPETPNES